MASETLLIAGLILVAAMLYSSVGHGGASGYLAVMALFNFAPATMRPTALILNIFVSAIAAIRFTNKGFFSWRKFYPFAIASIPFAAIGGSLALPVPYFKWVLGVVLMIAATLLAWPRLLRTPDVNEPQTIIPLQYALICGSALGLLSGLTGVGGGIFLSPLLLFTGWADIRQTAALSAMFILVNSIAGLAANLVQTDLTVLPAWMTFAAFGLSAGIGGLIGSTFGSARERSSVTLRRILAGVLVIASLKLILG
jgi:uncharacterized membrane protein YfcA